MKLDYPQACRFLKLEFNKKRNSELKALLIAIHIS